MRYVLGDVVLEIAKRVNIDHHAPEGDVPSEVTYFPQT